MAVLQPDPALVSLPGGPWRVAGASVRGTSHEKRSQPCQDAHGWLRLPGGGLAIAVADGAGSAKLSERGSTRAVEAALQAAYDAAERGLSGETGMTPHAWDVLIRLIFTQARNAVVMRAHSERHFVRNYATTLTVALVAGGWLAAGQIGDGAVVALDEQDAMFSATRLQKGEYANETHFLTQRDAVKRVQVYSARQDVKALAVMSDGLVRLALALPSGDPHAPFFKPLFGFIASVQDEAQASVKLESFLASERVCARTDDDKSLVLACYRNTGAIAYPAPGSGEGQAAGGGSP